MSKVQPAWANWGKPAAPSPRLYALPPPPPDMPSIEVTARLSVGLRAVADALAAEQEWRERVAAAIAPIEVPAIGAFTSGPFAQAQWGPKDGYHWAIQSLTVSGLASADIMQVFRGASTLDASGPQNAKQSWLGTNGAIQPWQPGRTGCILAPRQTLIFTGTLSGGPYTVNADVIQLESWLLPYFLL